MLIDAHCHLQDSCLEASLGEVFERFEVLNVSTVMVNGTSPSDWQRVYELCQKYSCAQGVYGLHPWFIEKAPADWFECLECFLDKGAVGVGECGLDKTVRSVSLGEQEIIFRKQLELASTLGLSVSIHTTRCWGRMLDVLKEMPALERGFLLHAYNGSREMVESFCDLGGYFSTSSAHEVVSSIPLERLLIETDAPSGVSPTHLPEVYQQVAQLRGFEVGDFAQVVASNAHRLFGV